MSEQNQELEVSAGNKRLKLRGSDLLTSVIGMIVVSGLTLTIYILITHKSDTTEILKEMVATAKESVVAQKEMNCLSLFQIDQREKHVEMCKRMSK